MPRIHKTKLDMRLNKAKAGRRSFSFGKLGGAQVAIAGANLAADVCDVDLEGVLFAQGELAALELLSLSAPADPAQEQEGRVFTRLAVDLLPDRCFAEREPSGWLAPHVEGPPVNPMPPLNSRHRSAFRSFPPCRRW
jgi:hypothetical protein